MKNAVGKSPLYQRPCQSSMARLASAARPRELMVLPLSSHNPFPAFGKPFCPLHLINSISTHPSLNERQSGTKSLAILSWPCQSRSMGLTINPCQSRTRGLTITKASNYIDEQLEEETMMLAGRSVSRKNFEIISAALVTVVLAVSNKVLYKMALVPLRQYPFFLAQVNTFGYVLVYSSILLFRYRAGIVTAKMLALPKSWFIMLGALEALGLASGMAAAAVLSGAMIPILTQAYLVWQLLLSSAFLKKRYTFGQVTGCLLVFAGVIIVVSSGAATESAMQQTGYFWPMVMVVSSAFSAGGSIIKEFLFRDAAHRSEGRSVDLFVVNTLGSSFQALFVFLLLPVLSNIRGISFSQLPKYMQEGCACFFNSGNAGLECTGAPLIPLLYVFVNLAFNISALNLLKMSSAVVSSLCTTLAVPVSIWMFTLPLPLLGQPASITPGLYRGATTLVLGLVLYNFFGEDQKKNKEQ